MSHSQDIRQLLTKLGIGQDDPFDELMQMTLQCIGALRELTKEKSSTIKKDCVNDREKHIPVTSFSMPPMTTIPLDKNEEKDLSLKLSQKIFCQAVQLSLFSMCGMDSDSNAYYPGKDLVECFPHQNSLGTKSWLPLQWASTMNLSDSELECLINQHPHMLMQRDKKGLGVMQYAIEFNNVSMMNVVSKFKSRMLSASSPIATSEKRPHGDCKGFVSPHCQVFDPFTSREEEDQRLDRFYPMGQKDFSRVAPGVYVNEVYGREPDGMLDVDLMDELEMEFGAKERRILAKPTVPVREILNSSTSSSSMSPTKPNKHGSRHANHCKSAFEIDEFQPKKDCLSELMSLTGVTPEMLIEMLGSAYLSVPLSSSSNHSTSCGEPKKKREKTFLATSSLSGKVFIRKKSAGRDLTPSPCQGDDVEDELDIFHTGHEPEVNLLPPFSLCL